MERKFLQKVVAFVLVLCLTATNFIFVAANTVYALAADDNIIFKAYFKEGDSQITSNKASISEGTTLYLSIDVKEGNHLTDGVIKIGSGNDEANYEIGEVESKYASVDTKTKEITLKDIDYTDTQKGAIEIALPISFEEGETISTTYFSKTTTINLSGTCKNSSEEEVNKDIETTLTWTEFDGVEISYEPSIEKIIYLEDKTIMQVSLASVYTNKYYPKETELFKINVPKVDNVVPTYTLLVNGEKIEDVTAPVGSQEISYTNNFVKDGQIKWNKSGDIYKVIYVYDGITKLAEPVEFTATRQTTLYNRPQGELKEKYMGKSNGEKGNIATVTAKALSTDVYKGYMYANSNETEYVEEYNMEISYIEGLTPTLEFEEDSFKTDSSSIATNDKTIYKNIEISKAELSKILGTKGKLTITLDNDQTKIIDSTATDKNGKIVVDTADSHNLKMTVVNAQNEGTIKVTANKAIQGNAGHDNKNELNSINAIETTVKAYVSNDDVSKATVATELKETVTQASLTIENESKENILSTIKSNKVEFMATLKTGTVDTDLLDSPVIKISLPKEVMEADITSVSEIFTEGKLPVLSSEIVEEDGIKVIVVKLDGKQESYKNEFIQAIKVKIDTELKLDDMAISRNASVKMTYINENRTDKEYETTQEVIINNPNELITKSSIEANFEDKTATESFEATIVNNTGKEIENISIIGLLPKTDSKEEFESNFENIAKEIKYSTDSKSWDSEYEDAKYYKVELVNDKLEVGEKLEVSYKYNISQVQTDFRVEYTYDGNQNTYKLTPSTKINGTPIVDEEEPEESEGQEGEEEGENKPEEPDIIEEETEKLNVKMAATIGTNKLKDAEEVYEGQAIRYTYKVKNNSDEDINNVKLVANHENANVFEDVNEPIENTAKPGEMLDNTNELEVKGKSNKEIEIGTLKANESKTVSYQIRVKENAKNLTNTVKISADDVEDIEFKTENAVKEAELKLEATNNRAKEYPVSKGTVVHNVIKVTNISDKDQEDIMVTVNIPEEFKLFRVAGEIDNSNFEILSQENNVLILKINKITAGVTEEIIVSLQMQEENPQRSAVQVNFTATLNKASYTSNDVPIAIRKYLSSTLNVKQTSNISGDVVKTGDKLIYKISIENTSDIADEIMVIDYVPEAAVVKNAYYIKNSENTEIEDIEDNAIVKVIDIDAGETVDVVIETEINEKITGKESITNYATISGTNLEEEVKTEEITYKLQANIKEEKPEEENENKNENGNSDNNDGKTENGANGNNNEPIKGTVAVKSSISGIAWLDANKDGIRQSSEKVLSGIKVSLANIETGKFVQDKNGNKLVVTTDSKGAYTFEELEKGKYVVVFTYDNKKYRSTEYRVKSATDQTNSDIITSKISSDEDEKYGLTDTLELNEESLENIDAGFVENEIFDLNLNKYVTKVTVQNSSGTTVKQYSKEQLAKLEIDAKNLAGSTVLVEYTIEVKNEGELAGYANEIIDYIPSDLTFSSEINRDWYKSTDGYLHTTALSKQLIEPGQTATVTLTLVKTMTENNTGLTSNTAEIAKASNEYSIPDKDSKPGNRIQGEDDMSKAELIISIRTGVGFTIGAISSIALIATAGTVIYIKKRREASHE